jgi:hypothetical protein
LVKPFAARATDDFICQDGFSRRWELGDPLHKIERGITQDEHTVHPRTLSTTDMK